MYYDWLVKGETRNEDHLAEDETGRNCTKIITQRPQKNKPKTQDNKQDTQSEEHHFDKYCMK